jgi:molybdopterin converting factor small subunit
LRNLSEDELVDKLGFTKNDNGMYPSENDYAIQYVDGKIVAITLTENDRGRFSLNGIQIGDTLSSAEKKLESEFTKIGSRVNSDGGNDTVYSGNNNETIVVSADNNDTVVGLGYTLMDSAAIGESMESSTDDSSSDMSTELVSDNDTQEMYADVLSKYSQYDGAEYGTFDIDGDGVDELIISYGTMSADWNNDIYSVIDGKAKKIGEVSGTQKFYKADDQNGIYAVYGHMGSEIIQRIVLSDGKISKIKVKDTTIKAGEEYYSNDYPIQMYYFDGSPVESEESESEESESDSIGNPASEYVLPESSDRLLSKDELEGLSSDDLMIARNEIYARHGRKFKDQKLQDYFDSCAWYDGYIEPEDFDDSVLSDIEKKNAELILSVENSKK